MYYLFIGGKNLTTKLSLTDTGSTQRYQKGEKERKTQQKHRRPNAADDAHALSTATAATAAAPSRTSPAADTAQRRLNRARRSSSAARARSLRKEGEGPRAASPLAAGEGEREVARPVCPLALAPDVVGELAVRYRGRLGGGGAAEDGDKAGGQRSQRDEAGQRLRWGSRKG